MKMVNNLEKIFCPKSVAFIGVSRQESKNVYVTSTINSGFKGNIFLINPKATNMILGHKVYPNLREIQADIDVAVITVPAHYVLQAVTDCVEVGVKGIIIITAGFAEMGNEGRKLQEDIVRVARDGGARIVGPNCLGIFSSACGLNTTGESLLTTGNMALVSQSGNMAQLLFHLARKQGLGFSKVVSMGNQSDINFYEYIQYIGNDPDTKVVLMYVEGFKDGRSFLETAKEVAQRKPLVLLKVGKTEAGARSAISHTGSLAGNDEISRAVFKQNGIIRVDTYYELLAVGETLSKLPILHNKKIAILGGGGGHGGIMADALATYGLEVPVLSNETQQKLKSILPNFASATNPIDIVGGGEKYPSEFYECAKICLEDNEITGVGIFGMFGDYRKMEDGALEKHEKVAIDIAELVKKYKKPVIMQTTAAEDVDGIGLKSPLKILKSNGVPVFASVEIASRSMAALLEHSHFIKAKENQKVKITTPLERPKLIKRFQAILRNGISTPLTKDIEETLREYEIPFTPTEIARNSEEAVIIAKKIGYPLAMKIYSPNIIHKSDANGVRLNIREKNEVIKCFEEIMESTLRYNKKAEIIGITIGPMEKSGVETIIGMIKDKQYGPVIMFGLGGIFVEVLKDVSFRSAPLNHHEAKEMIREIKGYPLLIGSRGGEKKDIDSLADIIVKVSRMAVENPVMEELDLNPVFVYKSGALVIDMRMKILKNSD